MAFYERGPVRIHYREVGSGFPLLLIPGGGLNSALSSWQTASPFDPMERYQRDFQPRMRLAQARGHVFGLPQGERALAGGDAEDVHPRIIPRRAAPRVATGCGWSRAAAPRSGG